MHIAHHTNYDWENDFVKEKKMANVLCVEGKVVLRPTSSNPRSWAEAPAEAERGRLGILGGRRRRM